MKEENKYCYFMFMALPPSDEIKSKDEENAKLKRRLLNSRWKNAPPPQQHQPGPVAYAQVVPQQQQSTTATAGSITAVSITSVPTASVTPGAKAGSTNGAARGAIGGAIMGAILPGILVGGGAAAGADVGAWGRCTSGMMMGPPRRRMMYG